MIANSLAPRILIYTHDAFGVGHIRRSLHIVRALNDHAPQAAILLVTGSQSVGMLKDLPQNADYVKLPTIAASGARLDKLPTLGVGLVEISLLRRNLIQEIVRTFAPDVLVVDNWPLGARQELVPTLHETRRNSTRTILGLRDIVDPPQKVRKSWTRQGMYTVLDRYYDRILIYGVPEVLDAVEAYALPSSIAEKVHYCGYVTADDPPLRTPKEVRAKLGFTGRFVLATVGGGGDGFPLLQAFLQALPHLPDTSAVVVTGELMTQDDRAELLALTAGHSAVVLRDYEPDMRSHMAAADVVLAMGGYNTTTEILALQARAIIVPRTWRSGEHSNRGRTGADEEQLVRAQALQKMGLVDMLHPDSLSPERLVERIAAAFDSPKAKPNVSVDVRGLERVAQQILAMTNEGE